jgi:hypothetical protein
MVEEVTLTVGFGLTVTLDTCVFEQEPLYPVTEYEVLEAGLTEILDVVCPELHEYVAAPLAVKLVLCPEQIVAEVTLTVGFGLTVTFDICVLAQLPL